MSDDPILRVNGADLCVETFGDAADPAILLIMGHEAPPAPVWDVAVPAILRHTGAGSE